MVRIGKQYTFDTHGIDSGLTCLDGSECVVLYPVKEDEYDKEDVGPMWRVKMPMRGGLELDAFDDELIGHYLQKDVLPLYNVHPAQRELAISNFAKELIADLGNGDPAESGDRTSTYHDFAASLDGKSKLTLSLIEVKNDLGEKYWDYALHVLNDIDEVDGYCLWSDGGSVDCLTKLLDDFAHELACCRA